MKRNLMDRKELTVIEHKGKLTISFTANCGESNRIAMAASVLKAESMMQGITFRELINTMLDIDEEYDDEEEERTMWDLLGDFEEFKKYSKEKRNH